MKSKINYACDLPLFQNNRFFDSHFVNTFIQQKALKIISDYRIDILENRNQLVENGYIEIGYNIKQLNKDYLSISIVNHSFLWSAHPYTSIDTLNFKFNPVSSIKLCDLIQYTNLEFFLLESINTYGNQEQKESLIKYVEYITDENINFVFDDKVLEISFINHIPRVIMALGTLEIPMDNLNVNNPISVDNF